MKKLATAFLVLGTAFLGGGLLLPSAYEVERSLVVAAPLLDVHALIADISRWEAPGTFTVTASVPEKGVWYDLKLPGGRKLKNAIRILPASGGTRVVWSRRLTVGRNPFQRYRALAMDGTVGPELEAHLMRLQTLAEPTED